MEVVGRGVAPAQCAPLPAPFQHGLRCAEHVFVGAQTCCGSQMPASTAFSHMAAVLAALDAGPEDLVRVGVWHGHEGDRALAAELDVREVIIPPIPGGFSALGLVTTDVRRDYSRRLRTAHETGAFFAK